MITSSKNSKNLFRSVASLPEEYPSDWPPKEFYTHERKLTQEQLQRLNELINNNVSETEIDRFFRANPAVLAITLSFAHTGHHGAWVIPQQVIRTKVGNVHSGLIPDYILGGNNSDGFQWWVVDLKGVNATTFVKRGNDIALSTQANEGLCQVLTYIDYCAEIQATLRDQFRMRGLREPKGLLLIGRDTEFESDEAKQKLKAAWNKLTSGKLEIRSYDALLRAVKSKYDFWSNPDGF